MAAKKKHAHPDHDVDHHDAPASAVDSAAEAPATRLEDVSAEDRADAPSSPARALQEQLQQSMADEPKQTRMLDTGRVLASASGITAILGVFIFSGIW